MGYVGGKIPGHSGTAQKHKKAFSRRKQWEKGRTTVVREDGNSRIVGKYQPHYSRGKAQVVANIVLGVLLAAMCGWWWFSSLADDSSLDPQATETRIPAFNEEQKHAYKFLVDNGHNNLALKDYRVAVYEFGEALKIAPYGKEARLGLLEAMMLRCSKTHEYCDKVEEQYNFVEGMGWLEEAKPVS